MPGKIIGLCFGIFFILIGNHCSCSSPTTPAHHIAIADTAAISKIILLQKQNKITLTKSDEGWGLNGTHKALPQRVKQLLFTLNKMRIERPLPLNARDGFFRKIAGDATIVSVFTDDSMKPHRIYSIGSSNINNTGTDMIIQGEDTPYTVVLPILDGELISRFTANLVDWRDRTVFNATPQNIRKLNVSFARKPDESFSIHRKSEDELDLLNHQGEKVKAQQALLREYLKEFSGKYLETYDNNYSKKDSILSAGSICDIELVLNNGNTQEVKIFNKPVSERTKMQFDASGKELFVDRDKFFALINGGDDFVVLQQYVFGSLFKSVRDFQPSKKSKSPNP